MRPRDHTRRSPTLRDGAPRARRRARAARRPVHRRRGARGFCERARRDVHAGRPVLDRQHVPGDRAAVGFQPLVGDDEQRRQLVVVQRERPRVQVAAVHAPAVAVDRRLGPVHVRTADGRHRDEPDDVLGAARGRVQAARLRRAPRAGRHPRGAHADDARRGAARDVPRAQPARAREARLLPAARLPLGLDPRREPRPAHVLDGLDAHVGRRALRAVPPLRARRGRRGVARRRRRLRARRAARAEPHDLPRLRQGADRRRRAHRELVHLVRPGEEPARRAGRARRALRAPRRGRDRGRERRGRARGVCRRRRGRRGAARARRAPDVRRRARGRARAVAQPALARRRRRRRRRARRRDVGAQRAPARRAVHGPVPRVPLPAPHRRADGRGRRAAPLVAVRAERRALRRAARHGQRLLGHVPHGVPAADPRRARRARAHRAGLGERVQGGRLDPQVGVAGLPQLDGRHLRRRRDRRRDRQGDRRLRARGRVGRAAQGRVRDRARPRAPRARSRILRI